MRPPVSINIIFKKYKNRFGNNYTSNTEKSISKYLFVMGKLEKTGAQNALFLCHQLRE